jgi:hypothetical protein
MADRDQHPTVSLRWLNARTIAIVVIVALGTAGFVGGAVAFLVQKESNGALRTNSILACDGVNLIRGDARLLTHHLKPTYPDPKDPADWLLRLRDCEATYDRQRIVIVSRGVEYRYLVELAMHHRVAIRDGGRRLVPMR